jgi:hypothetical protein
MSTTDFAALDDPDLISERSRLRNDLERLPVASDAHRTARALLDAATAEIDLRTRRVRRTAT